MPLITLLNKLLYLSLKLGENVCGDLRFLRHEDLEGVLLAMLVAIREDLIQDERVVTVQREDHLAAVLVRLTLGEDVLDHLATEGVQHEFAHLGAD